MRRLLLAFALLLGFALGGCAGLPTEVQRTPSQALVAPANAPLARVAGDAGIPSGESGFWPMLQSGYALDARVTLIRNATSSLDLQYYLVGHDTIGRLILRELRDAAQRGVRVRLLVDDLYTEGLDPLLLGLAAHPNVEVRLFNPFVSGRASDIGRFFNFVGDFRRLNHRMHNKLFIADGAVAVAGGRNLADEYFLRSRDANFLDVDLLMTGAIVPQLEQLFDRYWNSELVYPLASIVGTYKTAQALRDDFEDLTAGPSDPATLPPEGPDVFGQMPFSSQLAEHLHRFVVAPATAYADTPSKARADREGPLAEPTVTLRFLDLLREARHEVTMVTPYFIPGRHGIERLQQARDHGIEVRIITNAMGTSDEPLVNLGYGRYRREMLAMGVQLYEISASRLKRDPTIRTALGSSRGRLHAKLAFVDRSTLLVGSTNMDPRSAYLNTEIGIAIRSPELASLLLQRGLRIDNFTGVYQVQLKPDGSSLQWVGRDEHGDEVLSDEPDVGPWERFKLWLEFLFVPEDLL
jgi:phosphatidylserine/phosphatidylglycerophosphate/cardiolipin synthase-like enzyme